MKKHLLLAGSLLYGVILLGSLTPRFSAAAVGGGEAGNVTFTNSTTEHTTITDLPPVNVLVKGYTTQVLGILSNGGSNTTVFNVTVDSGVNLTEVRQQVALARQALQTAHGGTGNTNLRLLPTQLVSSQAPVVTTNSTTTETPNGSIVTFDTVAVFGPTTVMTGVNMTVPFFVAPGTTNLNTDTHTEFLVNRQTTTTSTTRKSTVYQVLGESSRSLTR